MQSLIDVLPSALLLDPGHGMHVVFRACPPVSAKNEAGHLHAETSVLPAGLSIPSGHAKHSKDPSAAR